MMTNVRFLFTLAVFFLGWVAPLLAQPAQDPWERMRPFDTNNDGKISREEFQGPQRAFDRMDADGDGFVTREEAGAMRGRLGPGPGGNPGPAAGGMGLLMQLDTNGDGKISHQEWTDFFNKADENGDGILQPEEWEAVTRRERLKDTAPAVGTKAPRVKAKRLSNHREVELSDPQRATVLIFGSYT